MNSLEHMNQSSEKLDPAKTIEASADINQKRRDSIAEVLASGLPMEVLLRRAFESLELGRRESPLMLRF